MDAVISWTRDNPPTGTGDTGFTLNNEFNALSSASVLCGTDFIRYKPYEDEPEETEPDEDGFSWGALVGHCLAGLTVVGIVAGGLAYGASLVFTGGATAVFAPWIVGGLAGLCGTAAVGNMAANDYQRGEVSSFDAYVWVGGSKALEGALAGAAFCMVPYAAEVVAATVVPYGMAGICLPGVFISGETIATAAMSVGYTVTCSNMLVKVNDSVATVTGNNIMANTMGQENYQTIKDVSEAASNTVFMLGLSNPGLYGTNNNAGNVKENASYQNGKTNFENEVPRSGEEWETYFKEKYGAENVVWESKGGSNYANLGNKLDYIFGKGSGNLHNIQRSQSMQAELSRIGIHDNLTEREYLTQHLNDVINNPCNISNVEIRSYIAKELTGQPIVEYTATTRESFLMGPGGGVKLSSVWDENRLITVVIEAGE